MGSKLVLVTGASSGIGEATAKRYGRNGASVLLLARNAPRLDAVAGAIRREGGTATPYHVDLSDATATAEVSARIAREAGTPKFSSTMQVPAAGYRCSTRQPKKRWS